MGRNRSVPPFDAGEGRAGAAPASFSLFLSVSFAALAPAAAREATAPAARASSSSARSAAAKPLDLSVAPPLSARVKKALPPFPPHPLLLFRKT